MIRIDPKYLLFGGAILTVTGCHIRSHPAQNRGILPVSFWVWQGPFALKRTDLATLRGLGTQQLFIRSGTFTSDGKHLFLVLPQKWTSNADGMPCHLVFNFDSGVISHFKKFDLAIMAADINVRVQKQLSAAREAGLAVAGVQFDFDVPTSQLDRYAALIRQIRTNSTEMRRGGPLKVSTTGLVTWLHSPKIAELSAELDFIAPQFYEGFTASQLDKMTPISDLASFQQNVHRADSLACPYFVGIPSYGHALLYDENGKLQALYPGLRPADALRHPSFKLEAAYPSDQNGRPAKDRRAWVGEEIMRLRAIHADRRGRGLGYTLAYTIPTAELLSRYLASAQAEQTDRCLGAIIYRYPEPGQSLAVPITTVQSVMTHKPRKPDLIVQVRSHLDSFEIVDSSNPSPSTPTDVYMDITNSGNEPTFVSPDAVRLEVKFDSDGFDDVGSRDMDSVVKLDEQTLCFQKGYLAPGQSVHVGPIRLIGAAHSAHVSWRVRCSDGMTEVSGTAVQTFDPKMSRKQ